MIDTPTIIKVGTRSSKLAVLQSRDALDRIEQLFPSLKFELVELSSPGDRDVETDLRQSPQDFFTKDLDEAVIFEEIDCALHSAKDLPSESVEGIDWFWLPWREDPSDALILPAGKSISDIPNAPTVGISSARREKWCLDKFPQAKMTNIRGNIQSRLEQLDNGDYDMIIMAAAALNRLGMQDRISELIPIAELPPPDGQGCLAVTFKAGNELFANLRGFFTKSVDFVGAGIGTADMCTLAGINAIKNCEVCIYDALMPQELLDYIPSSAKSIDAGKRCGDHHLNQQAVNKLLAEYSRRGKKVVRLKGGDPGIFGRLAEEVATLESLSIAYRVIPGISSLQMATTRTGMLMTRRGVSKGFCVMTPRNEGGGISPVNARERAKLPVAFFMAAKAIPDVADQLIGEGLNPQTPAALVYAAGTADEHIIKAPLSELHTKAAAERASLSSLPGLLLIGDTAGYLFASNGPMQGSRVLLTCSDALQAKSARLTRDFGGIPIQRPLIKLSPLSDAVETITQIQNYDWMIVTSPSAARCFFETAAQSQIDLRSIPKVLVCGFGTAEEFRIRGIEPDAMPASGFSASAVIETIKPLISDKAKVLRLRSDNAGSSLAKAITELGCEVTDCILYENKPITYESLPEFDSVFFASSSAVDAFLALWGKEKLKDKIILSIGVPTDKALRKEGLKSDVIGLEATVDSAISTLAAYYLNKKLNSLT